MRVANIIEEGRLGGPQIRMVRVAAELKKRDIFTTIIMPQKDSEAFQDLCQQERIEFKTLPILRITKELKLLLKYIILFPYEIIILSRFIKKGGFDLVHVSGGSWQYKGIIAAKIAHIPAIWHINDTKMPEIIKILFKLTSKFASGIIFASYKSKEYYESMINVKISSIIPSTVDLERFNPDNNYHNNINTSLHGHKVVGTICNINPIKGIEVIIRASEKIIKNHKNLKFIIVGPVFNSQKRYYKYLIKLTRELGVHELFIWASQQKDVRPLLKRFDVYVCSSLAESSPVSVWEAMAMGKPIVSTDVGDVGRHIKNGENGYIVPIGDDAALADRICDLLTDKEHAMQFGKNARKTAMEEFSTQVISSKTELFYRKVLMEFRHKN